MNKFFIVVALVFSSAISSFAQFTNVLIDDFTGAEEPSIAINPLNPLQVVAGANVQNSYYSSDGGATWITGFITSSLTEAGDPCLVSDSSGSFFYLHLVNTLDKVACQRSNDGGASYNNGSYTSNNNMLLQDKEWAAIDPHNNNIFVTWTQYDDGFNPGPLDSSRIFFARSTDHGNTFTSGRRINNLAGDCLYLDLTDPHPFVGPAGEVYVTFMDSNGIRFNRSLDTGNTWLSNEPVIDSGGETRYNGIPGVQRTRAMPYSACDLSNGPNRGNLYVSWADQRNGADNTDVFFIRSSDGGNTWTTAMKVNGDNSGNHQYRNAMAVDKTNGNIYIVYYDRRKYANNDSSDVYISRSIDAGDHWTDYEVSSEGFFSDGSLFDGDYIDIAAHDGIVRPVWTRIDNNGSSIWTCLFNEPGTGIQNVINNERFGFTVNPNPAKDYAVISFLSAPSRVKIRVTDSSGRIVREFMEENHREHFIDLQNLDAGVYFVTAGPVSKKLIIGR